MDVRLFYRPGAAQIGMADIEIRGGDVALGHDLETAVIISLFTDKRARPDDILPGASDDRRGWWGDTYSEIENDPLGSHLWLLHREKQTQQTLNRAREYCQDALQWLIEDGIASEINVTTYSS